MEPVPPQPRNKRLQPQEAPRPPANAHAIEHASQFAAGTQAVHRQGVSCLVHKVELPIVPKGRRAEVGNKNLARIVDRVGPAVDEARGMQVDHGVSHPATAWHTAFAPGSTGAARAEQAARSASCIHPTRAARATRATRAGSASRGRGIVGVNLEPRHQVRRQTRGGNDHLASSMGCQFRAPQSHRLGQQHNRTARAARGVNLTTVNEDGPGVGPGSQHDRPTTRRALRAGKTTVSIQAGTARGTSQSTRTWITGFAVVA